MKTNSKSVPPSKAKHYKKIKGNATPQQEKSIPFRGNTSVAKQQVSYASMQEAIQKIANPVSFKALKQFYNIEIV